MVSKSQYDEVAVKACESVLLELVHLLGEFKDEMVIIGGWVPKFLIDQTGEPHIGSLDIDIALDFSKIPDTAYQTILKVFLKHGYSQDSEQPFRLYRNVGDNKTRPIRVEINLMAGEYGGTGKGHRTQKIQDVRARKIRGCDLAFDTTVTVILEGKLPEGGKDKVRFKIAGIVPFLVMKGMALYDRIKEKDAYDIWYCVNYYSGGTKNLVEAFKPHIKNNLVREGLRKIRSKFASVEHAGPKWIADFLEVTEKEDRDIIIRNAYEKIAEFLDTLGIPSWD
jgi:hypothetical protein